ncbi:leucine-rich repeat extensin-like protein 3 [Actinidia eriantha]|uniref:leucine-rich repeat extensin-like protein 3 n=1 Tax=Actinidia eriantha TaxID=165200 RepID=UPI00258A03B1|nr:leucine-rich repeat extensin-like protein 3 [Actinidia eriantha]
MIRNPQSLSLYLLFTLVFTSRFNVSQATSAVTAMLRDQVACTMCSSCDNPCPPTFSPPPPSPPIPSPPPLAPSGPICPPPPSPSSTGNYYSPPQLPPSVPTFVYYSPPPPYSGGGGGFYPPPSGYNFPTMPPPNPIVGYFHITIITLRPLISFPAPLHSRNPPLHPLFLFFSLFFVF